MSSSYSFITSSKMNNFPRLLRLNKNLFINPHKIQDVEIKKNKIILDLGHNKYAIYPKTKQFKQIKYYLDNLRDDDYREIESKTKSQENMTNDDSLHSMEGNLDEPQIIRYKYEL